MSRRWLAASALLLVSLSAPSVRAYCEATSCDRNDPSQHCAFDAAQCETSGLPLRWASSCVTFEVQQDAGPDQGIDYSAFRGAVERAFTAWSSARCDDERGPSLDVRVEGPVSCNVSEYNSDRGNANIVMFREDTWPYPGSEDALGITRLRFDAESGELWDADIEVNAVDGAFSVGDPVSAVDLDSVLTHEAGHALGLAHTTVAGATMRAGYTDDDSMRSLEQDDVDGICAIYPVGRVAASDSCAPRHGFSELCGANQPEPKSEAAPSETSSCQITAAGAQQGGFSAALLGATLWLSRLRRGARSFAR